MLGGGLGKVAFLEPLPPVSVAPRRRSVGLPPRALQELVARVAIQAAAGFRARAVRRQPAACTDSGARPVIKVTAMRIKVVLVKLLTRRTGISVTPPIIDKPLRRIETFLAGMMQPAAQIAHVGANPARGERDEVLRRAILAIRHDRARLAPGVLFMRGHEIRQLRAVIAHPMRDLGRGNDSALIIERPMTLVTRVTLPAGVPHQGRVRIGRDAHRLIHRAAHSLDGLGPLVAHRASRASPSPPS